MNQEYSVCGRKFEQYKLAKAFAQLRAQLDRQTTTVMARDDEMFPWFALETVQPENGTEGR